MSTEPKTKHQPKFYAYRVIEPERRDQPVIWHRLGAVFEHEDGQGETLYLRSLPFDGVVVMRKPRIDEDAPAASNGA